VDSELCIRDWFWAAVRAFRVLEALKAVDAAFLAAVALGVLTAVGALVNAVSYLLEHRPHLLLGLFSGLVLATAAYVCALVREYRPFLLLLALLGLVVTFLMGSLDPTPEAELPTHARFFFSGMIAICAMLMPGISGSLLLVNMGMYAHLVNAVKNLDPTVVSFSLGAAAGLLGFSRVIKAALARFHDELMALICGILLSSLYLIWPWKQKIVDVPFSGQPNLLPRQYTQDPELVWVIALGLLGIAMVAGMHLAARRMEHAGATTDARP